MGNPYLRFAKVSLKNFSFSGLAALLYLLSGECQRFVKCVCDFLFYFPSFDQKTVCEHDIDTLLFRRLAVAASPVDKVFSIISSSKMAPNYCTLGSNIMEKVVCPN